MLKNISSIASAIIIPLFIAFIIIYGLKKKIKVYDSFCKGAKEGLQLVLQILPFMCAMVVAIGLLRDSGILNIVSSFLSIPLSKAGIPSEVVPLYLVRPFSGSAAMSVLYDIFNNSGVDSFPAAVASTMMGSTETMFYTIGLYFGSVGIKKSRHAIPAAMMADLTALLMSVFLCRILL